MPSTDPFYNRKQVPDEFLEHVGFTGLTKAEESNNRERKYSVEGGDLRKFSNPKGKDGKLDPYYQRKPVPDALIHGVGDTGLTSEQEFENRERKYSVTGVDVRKFGKSSSGGFHPSEDPYYGRKQVDGKVITDVGNSQMSKAEAYETRENKASLFDLSSDPFQQLTGSGHRASVSGAAGPQASSYAADARRRSSAVGPDAHAAVQAHNASQSHSGHTGDHLQTIPSRNEIDSDKISSSQPSTNHGAGETTYHYQATSDDVAPHERV